MGMSQVYGEPDDAESIATIHRALELGVTYLDTAEIYGPYDNEELLGKALTGRRDQAFIGTKFGIYREPGTYDQNLDGSPERVRKSIEGSLKRLGTDHVELYQLHRVDPKVPIEETVGAMGELVAEGKVLGIGLSEAGPETIRKAHATHPISSVQTEYSLWTRDPETNGVLDTCRELGIGFIPYSPLGRGFLTGSITSEDELADGDFRPTTPQFQGENFDRNLEIVRRIEALAEDKGASPAQLALAWVQHQGEDIFPIPGTKRRSYLEENIAAFDLSLTSEDLESLESAAAGVAGERYSEAGMATVEG
jgi:aryl-alcohol dehydrogenase-like predicted oxidoreductase